jgi:hypothetical protein
VLMALIDARGGVVNRNALMGRLAGPGHRRK